MLPLGRRTLAISPLPPHILYVRPAELDHAIGSSEYFQQPGEILTDVDLTSTEREQNTEFDTSDAILPPDDLQTVDAKSESSRGSDTYVPDVFTDEIEHRDEEKKP